MEYCIDEFSLEHSTGEFLRVALKVMSIKCALFCSELVCDGELHRNIAFYGFHVGRLFKQVLLH